jgi:NADPH2:quinone reductase
MKALLSIAPGGPGTLVVGDLPDPEPAARQVRITVRACGINFPDVLMIEDRYQFKPQRPFAPGIEVSGIVEVLGPGVSNLQVGDHVIAYVGWGGLAERVIVDEVRCTRFPPSMSFDQAAGLLITHATTLHGLKDRAALQPGETLLVLGAAGGVGLAAVELGKALGARVIAGVSTDQKAALAKAHGADSTFIYPSRPTDRKALTALFKDACGTVNVIYDPVGGEYAEAALRCIAWEGRYLVIGFAAGVPSIPLNLPLLKGCAICGVFWGAHFERSPERHAANMRDLFAYFESGAVRPVISERFPLERGGEAISRLARREAVGKLVVTIPGV